MRRLIPIGITTSLAFLALTGIASASIAINKRIDGVALGSNRSHVIAEWGEPISSQKTSTTSTLYYQRSKASAHVTLYKGHVVGITTYATDQRTKQGIGPGVRMSIVKKAFPGMVFALAGGAEPDNSAYLSVKLKPAKHGRGSIHTRTHGKFKAWNPVEGTAFTGVGYGKTVDYVTIGKWGKAYAAAACFMWSCAG
jgi:hypothetical protein